MPYLFVAAAVISIFVVVLSYKIAVRKLVEGSESIFNVQKKFFIGVSIGEVIPILIFIFGFMQIEQASGVEVGLIPLLIIVLAFGIGGLAILLQHKFSGGTGDDSEKAMHIRTLGLISFALSGSIPIVSIVALFIMMT